jgi:hypothetical protein
LSKSGLSETDGSDFVHNNRHLKIDDAEIILEAWGSGYKLWETNFSLMKDSIADSGTVDVSRSCYKSSKILRFIDLPVSGSIAKGDYEFFRLIISSPQLENVAYARIPLIKGPKQLYPSKNFGFNLFGLEESYFEVRIDSDEAKYASLLCQFYYKEFTDHWEEKSVRFVVKKDVALINEKVTMRLYEEFLNKLSASILGNPDVGARIFKYMDFTFIIADEYFHDYYSTYINVSNNDIKVFTNITNGFGLFSCARSVEFPLIKFDRQTLDSLCNGRLSKHLNFKEW